MPDTFVYSGRFSSLAVVATLGAIGCDLGSVLAYEVGAYGGRPLIERFGKYILMNRHDLDASDRFFQRYGKITVFVGRLLPVVRTFIALPAGIARMPRGKFHLYTLLVLGPGAMPLHTAVSPLACIGILILASSNRCIALTPSSCSP